jgi:hypothetical protein
MDFANVGVNSRLRKSNLELSRSRKTKSGIEKKTLEEEG